MLRTSSTGSTGGSCLSVGYLHNTLVVLCYQITCPAVAVFQENVLEDKDFNVII
jgi:hypothetical protein